MKVAEIGDNCIDLYERLGKKYPTGNVVDTGVNLKKLGIDVSIISIGDTVRLALEAQEILAAKGISAEVLDMHTIKPMDEEAVKESIRKTGKIITIEDHSVINGLGSAVADIMAQEGKGILRKIGVQDTFGETAPYDRLMEKHGITTEALVQCAEELAK